MNDIEFTGRPIQDAVGSRLKLQSVHQPVAAYPGLDFYPRDPRLLQQVFLHAIRDQGDLNAVARGVTHDFVICPALAIASYYVMRNYR